MIKMRRDGEKKREGEKDNEIKSIKKEKIMNTILAAGRGS